MLLALLLLLYVVVVGLGLAWCLDVPGPVFTDARMDVAPPADEVDWYDVVAAVDGDVAAWDAQVSA